MIKTLKTAFQLATLLLVASSSFADGLSIKEYVEAYQQQLLDMQNNFSEEDKVPVFINDVEITFSTQVKKSASGEISFWVVEAGAGIDKTEVHSHKVSLSFGNDGKLRVAEKQGTSTDNPESISNHDIDPDLLEEMNSINESIKNKMKLGNMRLLPTHVSYPEHNQNRMECFSRMRSGSLQKIDCP